MVIKSLFGYIRTLQLSKFYAHVTVSAKTQLIHKSMVIDRKQLTKITYATKKRLRMSSSSRISRHKLIIGY